MVFVASASLLNTQQLGKGTKTRWLGIMCLSGVTYLLSQWASIIKNPSNVLIYYKTDIIISLNVTCSHHEIAEILLTLEGLGLGYGT